LEKREQARHSLEECLRYARELNQKSAEFLARWSLAALALDQKKIPEARAALSSASPLLRQTNAVLYLPAYFGVCAAVAISQNQAALGARLLGAALTSQRQSAAASPGLHFDVEPYQDAARSVLGDAQFDEEFTTGATLPLTEALALCSKIKI
jgi:hypothetical protein